MLTMTVRQRLEYSKECGDGRLIARSTMNGLWDYRFMKRDKEFLLATEAEWSVFVKFGARELMDKCYVIGQAISRSDFDAFKADVDKAWSSLAEQKVQVAFVP